MMKKRNILLCAALAVYLLFTAACQRDVTEPGPRIPAERLPASLSLNLNVSDIRAAIETRSIVDPEEEPMSEEQLLADGRTIRRLTVLLIDSISGDLVAYRHIINPDGAEEIVHIPMLYEDDNEEGYGGNGFVNDATGKVDLSLMSSDKVRLTFNYDHPLHGDVERLRHGKYILMAMANYGSLPVIDDKDPNPVDPSVDHSAVAGRNGFVKQLHAVIHHFYGDENMQLTDEKMKDLDFLHNGGRGIENFRASLAGSGLYDYILYVATYKDENDKEQKPFVRKKLDALPLYTVGYIDLQPGRNDIAEPVYLYRTYARIRINVRNYSTLPLDVYGLTFSPNFSKDRTYFCRMPGASNIFDGLNFEPGAPDVSYAESIVAFPYYNTNLYDPQTGAVSKPDSDERYYIVEEKTGKSSIEQGQTATIFDAYISASRIDPNESDEDMKKYRYTIDLGYKDVLDYPSYSVADKALSGSDPGSGAYYAMKVAKTTQWLCGNADASLVTESLEDSSLKSRISGGDASLVWRLIKNGSSYRLQNVGTGLYIYGNRSAFTCSSTPTDFTADGKDGLFSFSYSYRSGNRNYTYYMYCDGASVSPSTYNSSSFELYPVEYSNVGARKSVTVDLQTIDNQTSAVTDVTEINRNDFVNVLVEVSYNPNKGNFEFVVVPWTTDKGGDVTFN